MKQYVCIKEYVTSEGDVAFKKCKIYDLTTNGMLCSELIGVKYHLTEQFKKSNFKKHKPTKSFGGSGIFDASKCIPTSNGLYVASQVNSRVNGIWTGDSTTLKTSGKEVMLIDANGNIIDSVVESVVKKFKDRSRVGIKKYGTTLDRNDLTKDQWITHISEELMDALLYLERLKKC